MDKWKVQFEDFDLLLKDLYQRKEGSGKLRFNRSAIIASDIGSQYYCEKKVEMQYLHGEIETEEKNIGTEAHERLTDGSMKVKSEELWQKIFGEKPIFALEMFLLAKYHDVIIAGKPDSVLFKGGKPLVVFEYKFSRSMADYPSYHAQAQTYGILLENMGFDTGRLFYAIVVADPASRGNSELRKKIVKTVIENGPKEATISLENAMIYFCKFDELRSGKNVDWAIKFWNKTREAMATDNPNKCAKCEYQAECTS
jgi:CRISPR/Cas system-associated exonuclease Cas4 (RecB family)